MNAQEKIARAFHEAYETAAPALGYETRKDSAVPWDQVPDKNRALMIKTVETLLDAGVIRAGADTCVGENQRQPAP